MSGCCKSSLSLFGVPSVPDLQMAQSERLSSRFGRHSPGILLETERGGRLVMAQRPIIWALGIAGSAALSAVVYGDRLARLVGVEDAPSAASMTTGERSAPLRTDQAKAVAARPSEPPTLTVAADYRGHYVVHPSIDNLRIQMLVDTGASVVALTAKDARALGIQPSRADYKMTLSTANGTVKGARVNLREVRLGSILVRNVEAVVLPEGALSMSLLGTSFLGKLRGYEVQTGRMVLRG
ncbi:TIGR02281 family clan AA aspartic protease [Bosea sp. (in: a-proteobacteria)]|uniref:retropepsin-like aspartic protease family protein n=1 Tax=Bosea sp. (in: a-proteobacteria) TaxID=1871050 RepID=UPI002735B251|nr:TIGR02281 family clan AA aspartic protease [Bosea sp. (in: a-proteobacteria)]